MTQNDKELLLKELCARLPHNVKCYVPIVNKTMTLTGKRLNYFCFHDEADGLDYSHEHEVVLDPFNSSNVIVKPYLRPISSMTEEEKEEYCNLQAKFLYSSQYPVTDAYGLFDWLNAHHFDYRGLIEKGLSLEAPEDMYK